MTTSQRNRLFEVLMEGIPEVDELGHARREMEEIVTDDLDKIEPLVDSMILDAFNAGKAFANRRTEADIVKGPATHVLHL